MPYNKNFYERVRSNHSSAEVIVPIIMDIISPESVVDVGCGLGSWLKVFSANGVKEVFGIDGEYVDKNDLVIPQENFLTQNLNLPVNINRKFDLAVSLEVAEHLYERSAAGFIKSLTSLAPVVLFSAAIPYQGGTNHLNEQWSEYWIKLFKENNFIAADCIRKQVWNNPNVKWWYAQNIFLFVNNENINSYPELIEDLNRNGNYPLSIIHPIKYLEITDPKKITVKYALKTLYKALKNLRS